MEALSRMILAAVNRGLIEGFQVNLAKSVLILVGNVEQVDRLAGILGCGVASLPVKYLGLRLGASCKAKHIWDGVIEKIECRLAGWKMLYLSKGGRVTLITLSPTCLLTICLFSLFRLVLLSGLRSCSRIFYGVV
ncbi:uncharacterized protein LOC132174784 [Corylus avellana]|uniref:uncharacterized protein LOC132174784 n=1 Tax=Corylus avellana TaxID=13451 RepID=UPI00286ADDE0|nr:uncharacterized protein LOC132174784 [Corylus avellana]